MRICTVCEDQQYTELKAFINGRGFSDKEKTIRIDPIFSKVIAKNSGHMSGVRDEV